MCDNSRLSGTSKVHEHDVSHTAEPNRAVTSKRDGRLRTNQSQTLIFFVYNFSRIAHCHPTSCLSWSTTFIFRRLEPESVAEKRGRKIEYKILLEWKWRIQALLRINTEKMHQPKETYVLFVNQALQNVVTVPDNVSRCTERAVYNSCYTYQYTHFRRTNPVLNKYRPAYFVSSP